MPDITMCTYEDCIHGETCYRLHATPDEWQSYSSFKYACEEGDFMYHIEMEKKI